MKIFLKHSISGLLLAITLLLGGCDLGNEFATNPAKRLVQTSRNIDDIVSGLPWYIEPEMLSLKAFRIGDTPYLAMKVKVNGGYQIIVLDKDLETIRTLKASDLPGWLPETPYWHVDGSVDAHYGDPKSYYVAISGGDPNFWVTKGFCYFIPTSDEAIKYSNSYNPRLTMRGPDNFLSTEAGSAYEYDITLSSPPTLLETLPSPALIDTYSYSRNGKIASASSSISSFMPNLFLMDFKSQGTRAVAYVLGPGIFSSTSNWGMGQNAADFPVFFLNTTNTDSNSTTTTGLSTYRIMDIAWDAEKDGLIYSLGDYIMDIRASNYGFIVPYPSGRDRLVDFSTGKTKFIFDLTDTSMDNNGDERGRNKPRAYLNGADFWFMYDRDSREIQRLKGWWE